MAHYRWLLVSTVAVLIAACSTAGTMKKDGAESKTSVSSMQPAWYQPGIIQVQESYLSRSVAISGDSLSALQTAIGQAKEDLESELSKKIENIRKNALQELQNGSQLDEPGFVLALRNAENSISNLASVQKTEVLRTEKYKGYRGFAETSLSVNSLIEHLEKELSSHKQAWNQLKNASSFQEL